VALVAVDLLGVELSDRGTGGGGGRHCFTSR
jgi:hypothetical protein